MANTNDFALKAKLRNWLRFRIAGVLINPRGAAATDYELALLNQIAALRLELLSNWDANTIALGYTLRPYKCSCCGKRSTKPYYAKWTPDSTLLLLCKKDFDKFTSPTGGCTPVETHLVINQVT